jgi:fatty-acyl-CoA synthase
MHAPSYVSGPSTVPLLGETIGENLRRTVERVPDTEALVVPYQNYRATYRQFWEQTGRIARALIVRGVKKGDRLGIWAPNRYEWVVLQYASARMGAILVNVNPAYRTHELEYALKQSGVSTLVLARTFRQADYVEMVREVKPRLPELRQTIVIEDEWHELEADAIRLSEEELRHKEVELQFDEPINIQYTSGTTGFPKGATLSHHNILNNGFFIGEHLRYSERDRVCIPVPLYHCFGMVLGNLAITTHGATMVFPGESFDPFTVMKTVQSARRSTACRRCSSRSSTTPSSGRSTSRRCGPGSWPARRARSRR